MDKVLWLLVLFVVSPLPLHLTRLAAAALVYVLLGAAWLLRQGERAKTKVERPALLLLMFLVVSGSVAAFSGNQWREVLSEIIPPSEVFLCFILVSRIQFDGARANKWLRWILGAALVRAAWQLVLTAAGSYIIPPIYGVEGQFTEPVTIGNLTYVRLIDPVCGLFVALAFILYLRGIERRLSFAVMAFCGATSLLGLTRSEWLASLAVVSMALWFSRGVMLRRAAVVAGAVALSAYLLVVASPDFSGFIKERLVDYTAQQIEDPRDELSALRILEVYTAAEKFEQAPLLGHGLGSGFGTEVSDGRGPLFVVIHNYYLNFLANGGLVGVCLLGWVAYRAAKLGFALYGRARSEIARAISLCALGSLLWWSVFVAFEPIYSSYHVTLLVGSFYGMAVQLVICDKRRSALLTLVLQTRLPRMANGQASSSI